MGASLFSLWEVETYVVKMACERPDASGRSLSLWDCTEIARQLARDNVVASIGRETIRRILHRHRLRPWRYQMWLSPKVQRDAAFQDRVRELEALYTRPLRDDEMILSMDEKTSLQPRPRKVRTLPARPGAPTRIEHEYSRDGALNLFAALDTRTGRVWGQTCSRKRQVEMIAFLESLDQSIPPGITTVHVVLDNVKMHTGKQIMAWLGDHPRFVWHHPPVHCSWMNQIEQFFSILQRKRLRIVDFDSKGHLAARLLAFIHEWNQNAHGFHWSSHSFEKILAKCEHTILQATN